MDTAGLKDYWKIHYRISRTQRIIPVLVARICEAWALIK